MTECIEGESMTAHRLLIVVAALLVAGSGDSWADRRVYGRAGVYVGPGPYWGPAYPRPFIITDAAINMKRKMMTTCYTGNGFNWI